MTKTGEKQNKVPHQSTASHAARALLALSLCGCSLSAPKEAELFAPASAQDAAVAKPDASTDAATVEDAGEQPDLDSGPTADGGSDAAVPLDATSAPDAAPEAGPATFDPQAGLVIRYSFDETTGNDVNDFVGDKNAIIAGTPAGFEQWVADGHNGGALKLAGEKPADGGVGHHAQLPQGVLLGLQECTISLWVNRTGGPQWQRVFDLGSGSSVWLYFTAVGPKNLPVVAGLTPGQLFVDFQPVPNAAAGEGVLGITQTIPVSTWVHFALTWSASEMKVYLDGKLVAQAAPYGQIKPTDLGNTAQNYLGRSQYELDPYFNGLLDEFRIYSRALSASDVSQLYGLK